MNRLDALRELLAKVEAGDVQDTSVDRFCYIPKRGGGVYADPNWYDAQAAYWLKDEDAAQRLQSALFSKAVTWDKSETNFGFDHSLLVNDLQFDGWSKFSPARAWITAILKALIANET